MTLAILGSLVFWPLYIAVSLALDVIGLVLLALLSLCHAWKSRPSKVAQFRTAPKWPNGKVTAWRFGWLTWLWGNEEDGVTGPPWWELRTTDGIKASYLALAWSAYRWSALRNPSNNLRFIPGINPVIEPARIDYRTGLHYWFVWQGPYAGWWYWFRFKDQTFRVIVGWKLKPEDAKGVDPNDMRATRCGFGLQCKRVS